MSDHLSYRVVQLALRRGDRTVLTDLNFDIASGQCVAVVGPNGAGKSTLLLALAGLLTQDHGQIHLLDKPMAAWKSRKALARRVAYLPQHYEGFTGFTVEDVVAAGRYAHQGPFALHSSADRAAIEQALQQCSLTELRHRLISRLSGGERQKVWLASAIAQQSDILLLDEPTAALDPRHQKELVMLLQQQHQAGKTLVMVCHDLNLALALNARVLALAGGRLIYDGTIESFIDSGQLAQTYETVFDRFRNPQGHIRIVPALRS